MFFVFLLFIVAKKVPVFHFRYCHDHDIHFSLNEPSSQDQSLSSYIHISLYLIFYIQYYFYGVESVLSNTDLRSVCYGARCKWSLNFTPVIDMLLFITYHLLTVIFKLLARSPCFLSKEFLYSICSCVLVCGMLSYS